MPMVLEPAALQEAPYQGRAGQTRVETVHVPLGDHTLRTVQVYRAVNVGTDPHLRDAALGGALHRLEGGVELAIPFVYHDPGLRKLALVLPESLRHEELRERAKLLEALASETGVPVPRYASEAAVVIGHAQLLEHLKRPAGAPVDPRVLAELERREQEIQRREQDAERRAKVCSRREAGYAEHEDALNEREEAIEAREQAVAAREQTIATREHKLRERAEDVTRREDELATTSEQHEASQRDLAMREQELEQRLEALQQRERELAGRAADLTEEAPGTSPSLFERAPLVSAVQPIVKPASSAPARSSRPPPPAGSIGGAVASALGMGSVPSARVPVVEPALADDDEAVDDEAADDDVEELDDLEPIRTNPGTRGDSIADALASTAEAAPLVADDAVEELVDDDDVEDAVDDDVDDELEEDVEDADIAPEETQVASAKGIGRIVADIAGPKTDPGLSRPPQLQGEVEMVARAGDGVDLFVSVGAREDAFSGECDLLIQLVVVDDTPVVLLTLVDPDGLRPFVRRAALDPKSAADRRVIEALRSRFEARIATFSDAGLVRNGRVAAPRELNAARVLDRISRQRGQGIDVATAIERVLSAPPPITGAHPFTTDDDRDTPDNAARTAAVVSDVAEWASPEKLDHALLVLSVPRDVIDARVARVLERAIGHGLALPAGLVDRAIAAGVAPDTAALVAKQIESFQKTLALPDRGGLSAEAVAMNWEKLLAAATDAEVALDGETHDTAWRAIREVRGDQTGSMPGGSVDPARLAEMGPPELIMLLEHPKHRRAAAIALCSRSDPQFADALCKAVRKMPRAEVVRVVPRITKLGDEAGDALIDGLAARKTFARQAFALALGHLKLRRAVVPLLHLITSEPTDVWKEVARVYGAFGNASFRTLSQKLHDPKAPEDRFAFTLAHLANHGCAKQVEALEKDSDRRVANMALRARTLRDEARRQEESASGKRVLEGADPVVAFSRRFFEELEGTAPDVDLAGDEN